MNNGLFPEGLSSAEFCDKIFAKSDLQTALYPPGVAIFPCAHFYIRILECNYLKHSCIYLKGSHLKRALMKLIHICWTFYLYISLLESAEGRHTMETKDAG
jgi:hypothetical protein